MGDDRPVLAVALKWAPLRSDVDPLTGAVTVDDRFRGMSPADEAALEWALRIAERWDGMVMAVTVAPQGGDAMLRTALACGARDAVRVDPGHAGERTGAQVAAAVAGVLAAREPAVVLCGDWSADRGSGSVPPFLAAELDAAQACGLVALTDLGDAGDRVLAAERRLDGGRRERLRVRPRAVLSMEGASARLRRAPLTDLLRAATASIEVRHLPPELAGPGDGRVVRIAPYRPPARVVRGPDPALPVRARIDALTGALSERTPPQRLVLDPEAAADRILEQLAQWGYR